MAIINRDADRRTVGAGVNATDLATPLPFRVDPTTGRLLVQLTVVSGAAASTHTAVGRDANRVTTGYGVDATTLSPSPFLIDHNTGLLYCDLIVA